MKPVEEQSLQLTRNGAFPRWSLTPKHAISHAADAKTRRFEIADAKTRRLKVADAKTRVSRDRGEVFKSMDKDGNGFVDQKEFCEAIENFKLPDLYARNPQPFFFFCITLEPSVE